MTFVNRLKGYKYIYDRKVEKDLKKLDRKIVLKIDKKLKLLVAGEQGLDVKKLTDKIIPQYRLRVGNYRVIYDVYEKRVIIIVVLAAHRQRAYKD